MSKTHAMALFPITQEKFIFFITLKTTHKPFMSGLAAGFCSPANGHRQQQYPPVASGY